MPRKQGTLAMTSLVSVRTVGLGDLGQGRGMDSCLVLRKNRGEGTEGGWVFGPQEQGIGFAGVLYSSCPLGSFLCLLRYFLALKLESSSLGCFLMMCF